MATKKKKSDDQYYTLLAEYLTGEFKGVLVHIESPDPIKAGHKLNIRTTNGEYTEVLILACVAD